MSSRLAIIPTVLLLLALFLSVNLLAQQGLKGFRLDLTESKVYTLSAGSRAIARSPAEPVRLTLYYSQRLAQGRPIIQTYAQRVRELLEEFSRASGGKVTLTVVDPEPFTDAEDAAVASGLQGLPVPGSTETLYLGLVGENAVDTREVIPFFDPASERVLEYEIARLVHGLANPKRPVLGVITSIPISGGFTMDPRTGRPTQEQPWQISQDLQRLFEVRFLGVTATEIPEDVNVLMLVHPKGLAPQTLFAIDQYVLRGGRVLAFVDPLCEMDTSAGPNPAPDARASDLGPLLAAWGVRLRPATIAADRTYAQRVMAQNAREPVPFVAWLGLTGDAMSPSDPITAQLTRVNVPTGGIIEPLPSGEASADATPNTTITPLLQTSEDSMALPAATIGLMPDPERLLSQFRQEGQKLTIAARLSGSVKTAFPQGRPEPAEGDGESTPAGEVLSASRGSINVVLVADADLLADMFWVRREALFGQVTAVRTIADNGAFVINAAENLAGSADLISVRAREPASRPFTRVEGMQRRADEQYRVERQRLELKLQEAQGRLGELQAQRGEDAESLVLTPEQQAEIDRVREEFAQTRKELRRVEADLRRDIERLGVQLQAINTGLMPALLTIGALGLWGARSARRRASTSRRSA